MRPSNSIFRRASVAVLFLAGGLLVHALSAAELEGRITLEKKGREQKLEKESRILIYFIPAEPAPFEAPTKPFEIVTVGKNFVPSTLGVPTGSTVQFPNQDSILHNVFSVSGKNRFDLGLYRRGQSKGYTFKYPGTVRVFCNVHHDMVAHVVVVDTPHITYAQDDGSFHFSALPVGRGTLTAWHERGDPLSQEVRLPQTKPLELVLEVLKPKVPPHDDKNGRSYTRRSRRYR